MFNGSVVVVVAPLGSKFSSRSFDLRSRARRGETRSGVLVRQVAVVAGGGEIGDALRRNGVDRLGDQAVLKKGLIRITDIVVDHLRAGGCELGDAGREVRLGVDGRIEGQARARGNGVDDLKNRASFVRRRGVARGRRSPCTTLL